MYEADISWRPILINTSEDDLIDRNPPSNKLVL